MKDEKQFRTKKEILGAFAQCIVRQYCYLDELEKVLIPCLREVESCINSWEDQKVGVLGIKDVHDFVQSVISSSPTIKSLNLNRIEREGGKSETENKYVFTDRYSELKPEYDFVDLDALARNISSNLSV